MAVLTSPPRRVPEQSLYLDLGLKGKTCKSVRSFLLFRIWAVSVDPLSKFCVRRAFWIIYHRAEDEGGGADNKNSLELCGACCKLCPVCRTLSKPIYLQSLVRLVVLTPSYRCRN